MRNSERPGAIILALILTSTVGLGTASPLTEATKTQQDRLARYAFVRTEHDPGAIGLLTGNAELGGLAQVSGLGIPKLWAADLWKNTTVRSPIGGPVFACGEFGPDRRPTSYRQVLGLADGVLKTTVAYGSGNGYEAELFCSMADRHCVVLRLKNLGGKGERNWTVQLPAAGCSVTMSAPGLVTGHSLTNDFTRFAWAARTSKPLAAQPDGGYGLRLAPGEAVTLALSLATQWEGTDYVQRCVAAVPGGAKGFNSLLAANHKAWQALWQQTAVLAIPDPAMERLWYRSVFWTLSTCGSKRFLPGECMFAVPCWDMHPFSYGAAGWAVQAFTAIGLPDPARTMLDWHFRPEALRSNAACFMERLSTTNRSAQAMAFGHEVATDGQNIPMEPYDMQRHLDAFGATLFYRFSRFYPDARYSAATVYPVLRGVAEFWRSLAQGPDASGEYLLPRLTSVTEDLIETNPIDAALAARWCLLLASRCAADLGKDQDLRTQWQHLAARLCIPQNTQRYLEYFGDQEKRAGGGYQGVRGFVYLGYPTMELVPLVDRPRAITTLEYTWTRNRQGEGMIGFVANWFALADAQFGRGEHALEILRHNLKCVDKWGTSLSETPGNKNYYFTTSYASYLLVPLAMAVQSCDDRIQVFPAVPTSWKDFAFYNVPAEAGIRVSGSMKDGKVERVTYTRDGKELLRLHRKAQVTIRHDGSRISLTPDQPS